MSKYITEFIGTFFLVLAICGAAYAKPPFPPLVIGSALMVMVYMGGHVSGAHYNPAVSLAVLLRGRMSIIDLIPYWVFQVAGAGAAAWLSYFVTGKTTPILPGSDPIATPQNILICEGLVTFALALVVLNVATTKSVAGNSYYGLAIGFTVMVGAACVGSITGGAFNPAVGAGLTAIHAYFGGGNYDHLWYYLAGPFAGGAAAGIIYHVQAVEHTND